MLLLIKGNILIKRQPTRVIVIYRPRNVFVIDR